MPRLTFVAFPDSSAAKTERSNSPNNDDERRDLIARQHRALYGNEAALYNPDSAGPRSSQDARNSTSAGARGPSPLAFEHDFGAQGQSGADSAVQMPLRDHKAVGADRQDSTSPAAQAPGFAGNNAHIQQAARATNSPSHSSPAIGPGNMLAAGSTSAAIGTIGSRSYQPQATSTVRPGPLEEQSSSPASNRTPSNQTPNLGAWGSSSGVWGAPKNTLGMQAPVWG